MEPVSHAIVDIDPTATATAAPGYASPQDTENIRILVRIRPPLYAAEPLSLAAEGPQTLSALSADGRKHLKCSYDHVLSPEASQEEVYGIVKQCTDSVLLGYNSTVFAYGMDILCSVFYM